MAKSTSMDSEAFHRSHKPQNGSTVIKIKDIKKNLNTEMTLGSGCGAGYGLNKPKIDRRVSKKTYTEDEVERKADNLLNELVDNKNLIESIKDLEEFNPKTSHLEQGLKRVIEISDDMSIDIPKISSYLSQIIAPLFNENLSVEFLRNALEPVKEIKLCADIISEALNRASDRLGHSTISDIFRASNLQLNEFLQGIDDSKEYINQHKLQWVTVEKSRERTTSSSVSIDQIENKLNQIFTPSVENKVIFDKIEKEYSPSECSSKPFIRALVIAVCNSCYNQNKFDADLFKKRVPILNKYIAKKEDLELESLFAIQTLDNRLKHQPGYMRIIFDLMYDEDIVREDVFLTWRTEDREEGHGICVLSLKAFFDWLTDADNDTNEA
ncbi:unnamed protein product [Brachionus calyciflorus]|uniref:W2 domain-containing protein n=1 Tax=Brachionus calyciflorus TaxID=104777 RepID=A0A814BQC8_9BILA|nr:unnamed protein product [Brachionus calyciflorus]